MKSIKVLITKDVTIENDPYGDVTIFSITTNNRVCTDVVYRDELKVSGTRFNILRKLISKCLKK